MKFTDLKCCPFCGGVAYIRNESGETCFSEPFYKAKIYCTSCPAEMTLVEHNLFIRYNSGELVQKKYEHLEEQLIARWNRRHIYDNPIVGEKD